MAPKRTDKAKQVAESSRPRKRGIPISFNPYNIILEDDTQAKRYSTLIKRKINSSRYMCESTLSTLGLKAEIDRMFYSIGLLDFMQTRALTNECITLEFVSNLNFKLQKKWIDGSRYYYGTLKFCLFNQNQELSEEKFGHILQFPIYGLGDIPKYYDVRSFWHAISGGRFYIVDHSKPMLLVRPKGACFLLVRMR